MTDPNGAGPARPAHLVALPGTGEWSLWRSACLRSSGFPVGLLDRLASPSCAAAADRVAGARPGDAGARTAASTAEAEYAEAYESARRGLSEALVDICRSEPFQEAMIWQNRSAHQNALSKILKEGPLAGRPNSQRRQHENMVVRYLQRYCAKNETIGFFGPAAWASYRPDGPVLDLRVGPGLVRERQLYFEQWGVDAVAEVLAAHVDVARWTRPRRLPYAYFAGDTVYPLGGAPAVELRPGEAAVLRACTGRRTARQIAEEIAAAHGDEFPGPDDVYRYLDQLRRRDLIAWRLEVPYTAHPDRALRALFAEVDDPRRRDAALRVLTVLESAARAVGAAAGDARRLDAGLERLGSVFSRLTGRAATARSGQMYAGRALVYEDCVRDVDVAFGPPLLAELGPPLSLALRAARWLTVADAARTTAAVDEIYDELVAGRPDGAVPLAELWPQLPRVYPALGNEPGTESPLRTELRREFARRWAAVIGSPDPATRRVELRSADLAPLVETHFPADAPGFALARYHSPDVMIAATGPETIRAGDFRFVLGEMHVARNTLASSLFMASHPDPEEALRCVESDLPDPIVAAVVPRTWGGMTSRTRSLIGRPRDYHLVLSSEFVADADVPDERRLHLSELVVERVGDSLLVHTYDRRISRGIMDFLGELASLNVINAFRPFVAGDHTPRVTVDRLVVQREAWRTGLAGLPFLAAKGDRQAYLLVRGWARELGLPRYVFVSIPTEAKPVFVDLDSPMLVRGLVAMLRRAAGRAVAGATVVVTEMLPGPEECWLPDAEGNRYTSELRLVVVDTAGRSGPGTTR